MHLDPGSLFITGVTGSFVAGVCGYSVARAFMVQDVFWMRHTDVDVWLNSHALLDLFPVANVVCKTGVHYGVFGYCFVGTLGLHAICGYQQRNFDRRSRGRTDLVDALPEDLVLHNLATTTGPGRASLRPYQSCPRHTWSRPRRGNM